MDLTKSASKFVGRRTNIGVDDAWVGNNNQLLQLLLEMLI